MASEKGLVFEKSRRAKSKASVSPKEILSIMAGKFNEESVSCGTAVKKKLVNDQPTVIPTHKMEMCRVCGKIGPRIRFVTAQRDVCSRKCEAEKDETATKPVPWIDFEADLTVVSKRELRQPERSLRRRGAVGSYRWQDAAGTSGDLRAAPVQCFPHAPSTALWSRIVLASRMLPSRFVVETELPAGDGPLSALWVARVTAVRGYVAKLRYEGVDDPERDFWVNLAAQTYPLGWAAVNGRPLMPPRAVATQRDDVCWRDFFAARLRGTQTLPWDVAQQLARSRSSRFSPGMRMELVDKDQIMRVRLACVESVAACRMHMRYVDATSADPGFVCHQDSPLIHPVGWAHRVGAKVLATADYLRRCEENSFLPDDAPAELFVKPDPFEPDPENQIVTGMKLEAIDPLNLSAICVGTVVKVLREGYLMVHIESYEEEEEGSRADSFCYHATSPSIFRVGFCQRTGLHLAPPKGFTAASFSWERYLRDTNTRPAPLPPHAPLAHGFAPGHRVEAADLMDPRKVCAASIAQVVGRLLRVHFDGWGSEYDQWMDAQSPDIYPVGWCEMVGHRLEPPCGTLAPPRNMGTVINITRSRRPLASDSESASDGEPSHDSDACPVLDPVRPEPPSKRLPSNASPPRLRPATARRATRQKNERSTTADEPVTVKQEPVTVKQEPEDSDADAGPVRLEDNLDSEPPAVTTQVQAVNPEMRAPRRLARAPARFLRSSLPPQPRNASAAEETQRARSVETRGTSRCGSLRRAKTPARGANVGAKEPASGANIGAKQPAKAGTKEPTAVSAKEPRFGSSDEDKPLTVRLAQTRRAASSPSPSTRKRPAPAHEQEPPSKAAAPGKDVAVDRTEGGLRIPGAIASDPLVWTKKDVAAFLSANDCGAFAGAFVLKEIDGPTFLTMTDTNIILLTSTKVGPALLIADLIQRLKAVCEQRKRAGSR